MSFTQYILNFCFFTPVFLLFVLFFPFFNSRNSVIPLSVRTSFNEWGKLRTLYETASVPLNWTNITSVVWCPVGLKESPQCECFRGYYEEKYLPDVRNSSLTAAQLGKKHGQNALMDCLRARPSWRKETCGQFCRLHISTPVILMCMYMIFFFSKLIPNENSFVSTASVYLPPLLALTTIITQLGMENVGGILSSISVVSSYIESIYVSRDGKRDQVFWSYHRYVCGAVAVWAAVTHQARDLYDVFMYGLFGFTAGLLAYAVFLVKAGLPGKYNNQICIVVWLGICSVSGVFVIAIQQHWYSHSRQKSSLVSVVCLVICLCQCLFQTPYDIAPVSLHILLSLTVLLCSFWAVMVDTW